MTVESVKERIISCMWFDSNSGFKRDGFISGTMEKVEEADRAGVFFVS